MELSLFYLANEKAIDSYLETAERDAEVSAAELNAKARAEKPELFERLDKARETARR